MIFLQTAITEEQAQHALDSLRQVNQQLRQQLIEDPKGFFQQMGEQALQFGLKVVAALVIYIVGIYVIRLIKKATNRAFVRKKTDRTVVTFVNSLISVFGNIVLLIIVISTLGINTTSLAALLAAMGMAIGMALSGTLQNLAGGVILLLFKPFKAGDYIETQGYEGLVTAVNIMTTKIRTIQNQEISLPNGALSSSNIKNFSVYLYRRCDWTISVAYGIDSKAFIAKVQQMLSEDERVIYTANVEKPTPTKTPTQWVEENVLADPVVYLVSLNSSDITFSIRAWSNLTNFWGLYFDMQQRFYDELPKAGFNFAYPHVDVTMIQ